MSWNFRPGRRRKVQVLPSASTSCPSTICGCGSSWSLTPYSVSQISSGAIADDILRGPDRIEIGKIGLRHETQHLAVGRAADPGAAEEWPRPSWYAENPVVALLVVPRRPVEVPPPALQNAPDCLMLQRAIQWLMRSKRVDLVRTWGLGGLPKGKRGAGAKTRGDAARRRPDRGGQARLPDLRTDRAGAARNSRRTAA